MKKTDHKAMIKRFCCDRDETVLYDPYLLVERTRGSHIWAKGEDEPYVDLLMGYSSTNLGHANPKVLRDIKDALHRYDNLPCFNSPDKLSLSEKLASRLHHGGIHQAYFTVGGAEAVDTAIKMARTYTGRQNVIYFDGAFHGYSAGSVRYTDEAFVQKAHYGEPSGRGDKRFPYPNGLRDDGAATLGRIDAYLRKNAGKTAAILYEPIQGAAGFIVPPKGFLAALERLAKRHSVLTICDEIQTGMGRTGSFYYIDRIGIRPDIVLIGKSLAGGYYPLGAVLARQPIFDSMTPLRSGLDATFSNNLFAIAVANRIADMIDDVLLERVTETGAYFINKLRRLEEFPFIKDINGVGLALSLRVASPVPDKVDDRGLAALIRAECFRRRLIIQAAGTRGDYIKLSPSLLIGKRLINSVTNTLHEAMATVGEQL